MEPWASKRKSISPETIHWQTKLAPISCLVWPIVLVTYDKMLKINQIKREKHLIHWWQGKNMLKGYGGGNSWQPGDNKSDRKKPEMRYRIQRHVSYELTPYSKLAPPPTIHHPPVPLVWTSHWCNSTLTVKQSFNGTTRWKSSRQYTSLLGWYFILKPQKGISVPVSFWILSLLNHSPFTITLLDADS